MNIESAGLPGQADAQSSTRPVVFVLPGLGGDQDPALEIFWGPTRSTLDLVTITYLDWTEIIEAGCDGGALAKHVARQIESRMPQGPIRMAGYSIGGLLAYSTASGLQAQGRAVSSVVILDAPLHLGAAYQPFRVKVRERLKSLNPFKFRDVLASVFAKVIIQERCRPLLHRLSRYRHTPLPFHFERYLHHKITMQLVLRIHPEWWQTLLRESPSIEAPTYLFHSEDHEPAEGEDLGWASHCLNLKVIPAAGTHSTMLKPPNNERLRAAFIEALLAENR
jgi:thioesterase domain-containing protein